MSTPSTDTLAPRIGITGLSTYGRHSVKFRLYSGHVRAAGGIPILLGTQHNRLPSNLSGLLLAGGEDVDPAYYEQAPHATYHGNHRRDSSEILLAKAALARQLPILAICRGCQLLNVLLGGSLVQDIPSQTPNPLKHEGGVRHPISVTPGSRLADLLGTTHTEVNSYHHQAVAKLAPGLIINAKADDGTVEGWEAVPTQSQHGYIMGIQWHPERAAFHDAVSQPIFTDFLAAARAYVPS